MFKQLVQAGLVAPAVFALGPGSPLTEPLAATMPSLMAFVAPLALAAGVPAAVESDSDSDAPAWRQIAEAFRAPVVAQVRIEQRLVVRVPRLPGRELLAELPAAPLAARFRERKAGKCLPIAGIAGVQIDGDERLLLFMRDQRLMSASLEKACRARDFYSGFYVERSGDGRLCVNRDMLHARSGASCAVSRLRQLVAAED